MSALSMYLFLHLLGAFLLAGGSALGEATLAAMRRTSNTQAALTLLTIASRVPMLAIPGALLTLIFGSVLVMAGGHSFGALWINLAYVGWLAAVGVSMAVLDPALRRLRDLAAREVAAGRVESAELASAMREPKVLIATRFLSAMVLLFLLLMVFKPGR